MLVAFEPSESSDADTLSLSSSCLRDLVVGGVYSGIDGRTLLTLFGGVKKPSSAISCKSEVFESCPTPVLQLLKQSEVFKSYARLHVGLYRATGNFDPHGNIVVSCPLKIRSRWFIRETEKSQLCQSMGG